MPIHVDRTDAPARLIYRYRGAAPSPDEQAVLRHNLINEGHLTAATGALMDLTRLDTVPTDEELLRTIEAALEIGGWPRRRAYVVLPWMHLPIVRAIAQRTSTTITLAAFLSEADALRWLDEAEQRASS
jgi:hypothetical protein